MRRRSRSAPVSAGASVGSMMRNWAMVAPAGSIVIKAAPPHARKGEAYASAGGLHAAREMARQRREAESVEAGAAERADHQQQRRQQRDPAGKTGGEGRRAGDAERPDDGAPQAEA